MFKESVSCIIQAVTRGTPKIIFNMVAPYHAIAWRCEAFNGRLECIWCILGDFALRNFARSTGVIIFR